MSMKQGGAGPGIHTGVVVCPCLRPLQHGLLLLMPGVLAEETMLRIGTGTYASQIIATVN